MNVWKRLLMWVTAACCALNFAAAQGKYLDLDDFAHYPSFTVEEGRFTLQSNEADALGDRFFATVSKKPVEMCVFHLAVEGNAQTGLYLPVLKAWYMNSRQALNATAVSLLCGGVRYDMAASSAFVSRGGTTVEVITAPLTAEAYEGLMGLKDAQSISLRLMGDKLYTTVLNPLARNERGMVEAASLTGLEAGFALAEEMDFAAYPLWDLAYDAWESRNGFRPAFMKSEVVQEVAGKAVTDDFGMVKPLDRGPAAKAAQALLKEHGFLSDAAAPMFGEMAVQAARRAQKFLGMIETGCMDAQLETALAAPRREEAEQERAYMPLGDTFAFSFDRSWFAKAVSASMNEGDMRAVRNSDHLLFVADGMIRNLTGREAHLFMQAQAYVVYNGECAFEAEILCEGSQGTVLDTLLLPMEEARMILHAQIPGHLAQDPAARWSLRLTAGNETIEIDMQ